MTALSTNRDTKERPAGGRLGIPAAASKMFFQGAIAAVSATGYATPGATATTIRGVGVVLEQTDNTAGADGAVIVPIKKGVQGPFVNSGSTDAITRAQIGLDCYLVDDQTVAKTDGGGTRSIAAKVYDVDADGVWLNFG